MPSSKKITFIGILEKYQCYVLNVSAFHHILVTVIHIYDDPTTINRGHSHNLFVLKYQNGFKTD